MKKWIGTAASAEAAVEKGLKHLSLTKEKVEIRVLEEKTSTLLSLFGLRRVKVELIEKAAPRSFFRDHQRGDRDDSRGPGRHRDRDRDGNRSDERRPDRGPDRNRQPRQDKPFKPRWQDRSGERREGGERREQRAPEETRNSNRPPRQLDEKILQEITAAVQEVRETGNIYRLDPMESWARRLVHQTLANNPDVETASEGDGPFRKVVIKPRTKDSSARPVH